MRAMTPLLDRGLPAYSQTPQSRNPPDQRGNQPDSVWHSRPGFGAPAGAGATWPVDGADGLRPPSLPTGPPAASWHSVSFMLHFTMPVSGRTNGCPGKPGAAHALQPPPAPD